MAQPGTRILTVDLVNIAGLDIADVNVTVELAVSALVFPIGVAPDTETLFPNHLTAKTDAQGIATFPLLPSSIVGNYRVIVGGFQREVTMPDMDVRLSQLGGPSPPVIGAGAYPQTAAQLRTLILQGVLYTHLFRTRPMRVAWKQVADIAADPFVEADFLGAQAAQGDTASVTWSHSFADYSTGFVAVWIYGNFAALRLRYQDEADWDTAEVASLYDSSPLTVSGDDGTLYVTNGAVFFLPGEKVARAILDPGAPNF